MSLPYQLAAPRMVRLLQLPPDENLLRMGRAIRFELQLQTHLTRHHSTLDCLRPINFEQELGQPFASRPSTRKVLLESHPFTRL
jgi:hypothetical protein